MVLYAFLLSSTVALLMFWSGCDAVEAPPELDEEEQLRRLRWRLELRRQVLESIDRMADGYRDGAVPVEQLRAALKWSPGELQSILSDLAEDKAVVWCRPEGWQCLWSRERVRLRLLGGKELTKKLETPEQSTIIFKEKVVAQQIAGRDITNLNSRTPPSQDREP